MKHLKIIILSVLLVVVHTVNAQNYVFKVLLNKGENSYGRAEVMQPVKTGTLLFNGDKLSLKQGAYIGLMHKNGNTVEVKTAGMHDIAELGAQLEKKSQSGIMSRFAEYIFEKVGSKEDDGRKMSIAGAVERTVPDATRVYLSDISNVYGDKLQLVWEPVEGNSNYSIHIKNQFDEKIESLSSKSNKIQIDLAKPALAKQRLLIISVSGTAPESFETKGYGIRRLSGDRLADIQKMLSEIEAASDASSPLDQIIIAGFYEQEDLPADALRHYHKAMELAPDNTAIAEMYDGFLLRYGYKSEN
ncbi:MAG: hypothetical protein ACFCUU_11035 [Cyclobacteriaceae bacterium]